MTSFLYRVLIRALPCLALLVIVFGAYVRLTDAGLGCPDWPGCYGHLAVPADDAQAHLADPDWHARPLEQGKAWREMLHRYLASTLGFGMLVLAVLVWRRRRAGLDASRLAYALVPLVMLQGLLGMWTVTLLLKPMVVLLHLLGGLATLAGLWWLWLGLQHPVAAAPGHRSGRVARVAVVVLLLQIMLGGWTSTNYAALACTDFPTCHGRWWPQMDFSEAFVLWRGLGVNYEFGVLETPARTAIHVSHRLGALVVSLVLVLTALAAFAGGGRRIRTIAWCILAALGTQLALGISNVLGGLPLAVAVMHNGVAAILLLCVLTLIYHTRGHQPAA